MKTAALILGILGGLAAGALGVKWLSDIGEMTETQRMVAQATGQMGEFRSLGIASFLLIGGCFAGVIGGIFAKKGRFALGGGLMLLAGVLPLFYAPEAILGTFLLLLGGVIALAAHMKAAKAIPAP